MSAPRTLFEKIWDAHQVAAETEAAPGLIVTESPGFGVAPNDGAVLK